MAIKINGTTVIDDSRNLVNIVSGAGSSTTYGDVGTYLFAAITSSANLSTTAETTNETVPGSDLKPSGTHESDSMGTSPSGTWRLMGLIYYAIGTYRVTTWVRIS